MCAKCSAINTSTRGQLTGYNIDYRQESRNIVRTGVWPIVLDIRGRMCASLSTTTETAPRLERRSEESLELNEVVDADAMAAAAAVAATEDLEPGLGGVAAAEVLKVGAPFEVGRLRAAVTGAAGDTGSASWAVCGDGEDMDWRTRWRSSEGRGGT